MGSKDNLDSAMGPEEYHTVHRKPESNSILRVVLFVVLLGWRGLNDFIVDIHRSVVVRSVTTFDVGVCWMNCINFLAHWQFEATKEISSPVPRNFVPEDCMVGYGWMRHEQFRVPNFDKALGTWMEV